MSEITIQSTEAQGTWLITLADGRKRGVTVLTPAILHVYDADVPAPHNRDVVSGQALAVAAVVDDHGDHVTLATSALTLTMDAVGYVDVVDASGQPVVTAYRGRRQPLDTNADPALADAEHAAAHHAMVGEHHVSDVPGATPIEVAFTLADDDHFYGLGDKTGFTDKRGYAWENWNSDDPTPHQEDLVRLYKSIPFVIGLHEDRAYGLFFPDTFPSRLDLGRESRDYFYYNAVAGRLDYYIFAGPAMPDVVGEYTWLTGTTPLPQKWTLGYQQSRWSYMNRQTVETVAAKMREYHLPFDAIHLDIDYMDGYRVFTTDPKRFPDFKQMVAQLGEDGVKVVTIIDPGVKQDPGYRVYDEGVAHGYFAKDAAGKLYVNRVWPGKSVFPDFGAPSVRKWWAHNTDFLTENGVSGIWNDMNEPASFDGPLPDDVALTDEDHGTTILELHNVYAHNMARATYAGMKAKTGKRPFIITRAAFSGTQKFATVWTGDNRSTWALLRLVVPQLTNLGLSGFSFAGTDIGGFGESATPELLTRWIEAAIFSPLLRNHSAIGTPLQEPWVFGEPTLAIYRKMLELRYRLLDLLYDLFEAGTRTGLPVMRPLVLHYQDDATAQTINDEFLVGETLLAAPVVAPGVDHRMVYLPAGEWLDYWTGEAYTGGDYYVVAAPLDHLPLFVKNNSILPLRPLVEYVEPATEDTLGFKVFGTHGHYEHYQDNGEDFAYQNGAFNRYVIDVDDNEVRVALSVDGLDQHYDTIFVEVSGVAHQFAYSGSTGTYQEI
uniref:glycoside hydrolase family 31 protein n=1 Tax=Lacticaseibacillus mingshuiensis TaxID=2799574 RepID=UPI0019506EAE|nr:TIM-barrel domain-containing protein [Lacticaseibacillus mingshuiensis]